MAEIEFLPLPRSSSEASDPVESSPAKLPETPVDSLSLASPMQDQKMPDPQAASHRPGPVSFRPLTPDEIAANVKPDYEATGNPLPDPSVSTFIGALAGDQVIAYLCLQVKLHAQPLVIRPGHQNVFKSLVAAAEAHILATIGPTWVYLFTPAGRLSQIAQSMGMQLEPWCVMSKLVQPEPPQKPAFEIITQPPAEPGPFLDESYQAVPDDSAWESLFPNGVLPLDPTGRVQ